MTPKPRRKENRGLPKRWRYKNGAYRYLVPPGQERHWDGKKEFKLGKTLNEAYRVWAERLDDTLELATCTDLMDRYLIEVVPAKSYKTQESDKLAIRRLRPVFGKMRPDDVEPSHAYKYFDLVFKKHGFTSDKHDISTFRHVLTKAVQWGVIRTNPLKGRSSSVKKTMDRNSATDSSRTGRSLRRSHSSHIPVVWCPDRKAIHSIQAHDRPTTQ